MSQYHSASRACKVTRLQSALHNSASATEPPKAAALVIGNEILNGSVVDTNTPWLAKLLHRCASHSVLMHFCMSCIAPLTGMAGLTHGFRCILVWSFTGMLLGWYPTQQLFESGPD